MIDVKLNENHDLYLGKNQTVTDLEKVKQDIFVKLQWFRGEWEYDVNLGVPYFESILGQRNPDVRTTFSLLARAIETVANVIKVELQDFDFDGKTKKLRLDLTVDTIFGQIPIKNYIL
jgi:hypothetical protein